MNDKRKNKDNLLNRLVLVGNMLTVKVRGSGSSNLSDEWDRVLTKCIEEGKLNENIHRI
jgi:hypothetical protein